MSIFLLLFALAFLVGFTMTGLIVGGSRPFSFVDILTTGCGAGILVVIGFVLADQLNRLTRK